MHTFDPSTQEAETGESLKVQGQPTLQSELQDIQDYTEKPCFEKIKKKKKKGFYICVCVQPSWGHLPARRAVPWPINPSR